FRYDQICYHCLEGKKWFFVCITHIIICFFVLVFRQALKKYVQSNNDIKTANFDALFNTALRKGVESGDFLQPKGPSGPVKAAKKEKPVTAQKVKKPAAAKKVTKKPAAAKKVTKKAAAAPKKVTKKAAAPKKVVKKTATKKASTTTTKKAAPKKKTTTKKSTK
ncbi:uncharacterized protein SPAPADRAFT_144325, partial [Spathaspora passalidarum NRRL Y-27907]